jgi:polyhydroxybutyrate depolymerase
MAKSRGWWSSELGTHRERSSHYDLAMKRYLKLFTVLVSLTACATVTESSTDAAGEVLSAARDFDGSIESGGIVRSYQVHVPARKASQALPLVLVLHGGGGNGAGMRTPTGMDSSSNTAGFIAVYPDGQQKNWSDGRGTTDAEKAGVNDVAFLSSLVRQLSSELNADPKRIYVTGISNGGFMSARLACDASSVFAAVAVVAATMPENVRVNCKPSRAVPFMLIHGTADKIIPASGGTMTKGDGGVIASAVQTVDLWRNLNKCLSAGMQSEINLANDGTSITLERYTACASGSEVAFFKVTNGGHTWPGGSSFLPEFLVGKTSRDLNASEAILAFFKSHPQS